MSACERGSAGRVEDRPKGENKKNDWAARSGVCVWGGGCAAHNCLVLLKISQLFT